MEDGRLSSIHIPIENKEKTLEGSAMFDRVGVLRHIPLDFVTRLTKCSLGAGGC